MPYQPSSAKKAPQRRPGRAGDYPKKTSDCLGRAPERIAQALYSRATVSRTGGNGEGLNHKQDNREDQARKVGLARNCLLYTSDAADDLLCVDLGGRRIIKKKKQIRI